MGRVFSIVRAFKRLGSWQHVGAVVRMEAKKRVEAAFQALWPLKKPILESPLIDQRTKLIFVSALVFSRLFFAVDAWTQYTAADLRVLEHARIVALRMVLGVDAREH
eukprot:8218376-Lingulodinium_polyedra.AAC.1